MTFYICNESELEFLRLHPDLPLRELARVTTWLGEPFQATSKLPVGASGLKEPVHILLRRASDRRYSPLVREHVCKANLPDGCFIDLGGGLAVCSPELLFLLMASRLSLIGLILLGFELCGTYSMREDSSGQQATPPIVTSSSQPTRKEVGFNTRPALTSVTRLAAFLASVPGMTGRVKALRALRYVIDGSASPMETKLALLLTLPNALGGYGFPKAELNHRITPAKRDKRGAAQKHYDCDLFWPDHHVALEYDSDLFHTTTERMVRDAVRRNALSMLGVKVYTVTNEQFQSEAAMNRMAYILARAMSLRLRPTLKNYPARRRALHRLLIRAYS